MFAFLVGVEHVTKVVRVVAEDGEFAGDGTGGGCVDLSNVRETGEGVGSRDCRPVLLAGWGGGQQACEALAYRMFVV